METRPQSTRTAPQTPLKQQSNPSGPPTVNSTPNSNHTGSHRDDVVHQVGTVVDEWLLVDISETKVMSLADFGTVILGLPDKWEEVAKYRKIPESVDDAFNTYIVATKQKSQPEKTLYDPLAILLNALGNLPEGEDADSDDSEKLANDEVKAFYVQDPNYVRGYVPGKKPDLGSVYCQKLSLGENETLDQFLEQYMISDVWWALMLFFVEVKHENGNLLKTDQQKKLGTRSSQLQSGSKKVASASVNAQPRKRIAGRSLQSQSIADVGSSGSNKRGREDEDESGPSSNKKTRSRTTQTSLLSSSQQQGTRSSSRLQKKRELSQQGASSLSNAVSGPALPTAVNVDTASGSKATRSESGNASSKKTKEGEPQNFIDTRKQVATYGKALLSRGLPRSHAIGVILDDSCIRLHYYDHSAVIESEPVVIEDEYKPQFMALVNRIHHLTGEELGFIPHLKADFLRNDSRVQRVLKRENDGSNGTQTKKRKPTGKKGQQTAKDSADAVAELLASDKETLEGATYTMEYSGDVSRTFRFNRVFCQPDGLNGRGTLVVEAKCTGEKIPGGEESWIGRVLVLKFSFPSSNRTSENALIDAAIADARLPAHAWALNHLPVVLRSVELTYAAETTSQGRLKEHYGDQYEKRVIRVTVLEKLEPLMELKSAEEFAQVFYDILQIHKWLHDLPKILHRDLSINNIMFRRIDGKVYGVLNDFDLSSYLKDVNDGPTSKYRTGTRPFMAYDLLNKKWHGGHMYRHDLESLFYIMLIVCCHYDPGNSSDLEQPYLEWFNGNDARVAGEKLRFLFDDSGDPLPIQSYFEGFRVWLKKIYFFFRLGIKKRPLPEEENADFDWNTLNESVTYEKMLSVMSSFQENALETRTLVGKLDNQVS